MKSLLLDFIYEETPQNVPKIGWRDAALVVVIGLLELLLFGVFVNEAQGPVPPELPILIFATLAMIVVRRDYPLLTLVLSLAFSIGAAWITIRAQFPYGFQTVYAGQIFLYTLARWASGRKVVIGVAVALLVELGRIAPMYGLPGNGQFDGVGRSAVEFIYSLISLVIFVMFPVVIGYGVRYFRKSHDDALDQVRQEERMDMARELHDTVAHHVTAIAVQANAGKLVAAAHPEKAAEHLDSIGTEATTTLVDMRRIVGALREGEEPQVSMRRGVADLLEVVTAEGSTPTVAVSTEGDLLGLPDSISNGLYRIVQESLTNARRHAEDASWINVQFRVAGGLVYVKIENDGRSAVRPEVGFGIAGMAERAEMLGGTLIAEPRSGGGWVVEAELPLEESR